MEYNKLIAEMSLSDEVEGFYVLKAAYPRIIHEADKYGEVHLPSIRF